MDGADGFVERHCPKQRWAISHSSRFIKNADVPKWSACSDRSLIILRWHDAKRAAVAAFNRSGTSNKGDKSRLP